MKLAPATAEERRRRVGILLGVVGWLWVVVPRIVQSLTAPKLRTEAGIQGPAYTNLTTQVQAFLTLAVIGVCVLAIVEVFRLAPRGGVGRLGVLLLPWVYLVFRDMYVQDRPTTSIYLYPLIAIAMWVLRPPLSSLRWLGYLTGFSALISIAMAVFKPTSAIFYSVVGEQISEDKQILPWGLLEGFFTQPNNLGQLLVIGLPTIFLIRRGLLRTLLAVCTVFALIWTASRSSMYTAIIVLVMALAVRITRRERRNIVGLIGLFGIAAAVCLLPLITTDPEAYTTRGFIWQVSLHAWQQGQFFGLGANWYDQVAATSANLGYTVFHGHNQFVQLLVTGGVVLVVIVVWEFALVSKVAAALARTGESIGVIYLSALFGTCLLEVSLDFVDNGAFLSSVVIPVAVLMFSKPEATPPQTPQDRVPVRGALSVVGYSHRLPTRAES